MHFKKIKYDGTQVTLVTTAAGAKWEKEETITSRETPHPDFIAALGALAYPVVELCELPEEYVIGLTVRGVSFSRDEDGYRGAVVTALKALETVPAPLVINTPHVSERPDGDGECTMPGELELALERLEREAKAFAGGKKAQADLFDDQEREAEEETQITLQVPGREPVTATQSQMRAALDELQERRQRKAERELAGTEV